MKTSASPFISVFVYILIIQSHVFGQKAIWQTDPEHSFIQFEVSHLTISTVVGYFNEFSAKVESHGNNFSGAKANAIIDVNSVDTKNMKRDKHLKEDDFFNVAKFPSIRFTSTEFTLNKDGTYTIIGDLTIRDVTKPIKLEAKYNGEVSFEGKTTCGFTANGSLNRFDYGLKWNDVVDSGGFVVGETVKIILNLRLVKQ